MILNNLKPLLRNLMFFIVYFLFYKLIVFTNSVLFFSWGTTFMSSMANRFKSIFGEYTSSLFSAPFYEWSMTLDLIQNPIYFIYFLVIILVMFFVKDLPKWGDELLPKNLKIVLGGCLFVFTWNYAFYDFNLYLDQWHLLDRIVLILLAGATLFRPYFLAFYIPILYTIISQFYIPMGEFSLTDKQLPLFVLQGFEVWLVMVFMNKYLKKINRISNWGQERFKLKQADFVLALLVIIASAYFTPFVTKMRISPNFIDWPLIEEFGYASMTYFNRGWLLGLSQEIKDSITFVVTDFKIPFLITAFVIEGVAILLFIRKKISIYILSSFILLHGGIFLLSGIFFWKWIIVDLCVIIFLKFQKENLSFGKMEVIVPSMIFVILSASFLNFASLGWYSLKHSNQYLLNVETESGDEFIVRHADMTPYDIFFTFSSRWNLLDSKTYPMTTNSSVLVKEVSEIKDFGQMEKFIEKNGKNNYSLEHEVKFNEFVKTFLNNYNKNGKRHNIFQAPMHINMDVDEGIRFNFDENVVSFQVVFQNCFYSEINKKECKEFALKRVSLD